MMALESSEEEQVDERCSRMLMARVTEVVDGAEGGMVDTEQTVTGRAMATDSLTQHISWHPLYLHRRVLAVEAALVVA